MVTHIPPSPTFSSSSYSVSNAPSSTTSSAIHRQVQYERSSHHSSSSTRPPRSSFSSATAAARPQNRSSQAYPPSSSRHDHSKHHSSRRGPRSSYTYDDNVSEAPSNSSYTSTSATRSSRHRTSQSRSIATERHPQAQVQNAFPWFASGDVEIVLRDPETGRSERRYLLHKLILAQHSEYFAEEFEGETNDSSGSGGRSRLSDAEGGNSSSKDLVRLSSRQSRRSNSTLTARSRGSSPERKSNQTFERVCYELDWSSTEALPLLRRMTSSFPHRRSSSTLAHRSHARDPPSASNGSSILRHITRPFSNNAGRTSASNSSTVSVSDSSWDVFEAHENLLLTFYNHSPRLDTHNIATAYGQCKLLLSLASLYGALPVVRSRIDHHLLRFRSKLWRQIAKYPPSYLKLGYTARSRAIFAEALVHVAGTWPQGEKQLVNGGVDKRVLDLVRDKVDELEELRAKVDAKLFRLTLTTTRGERVTPDNNWLDFLAVSLFRHWLAEQTSTPTAGILKHSSSSADKVPNSSKHLYSTYMTISQSGQAYLSTATLKQFLKLRASADYDRDTLRKFERRIGELKNQAGDIVRPLVRCALEGGREEAQGLCCCWINDSDWAFVSGEDD